jgi:hypothetical protein
MQITTTPMSPAVAFTTKNAWLTQGDHNPIVRLEPVGMDTVNVVVRDGWAEDGDSSEETSQMVADAAAGMLEPVVDGVKLLVTTASGYQGRPTFFTADENYFATSLPGVQSQVGEVGYDVNGDGVVGDDETAYLFEMDSAASAGRLDPLIRDSYGDYPVRFDVNG